MLSSEDILWWWQGGDILLPVQSAQCHRKRKKDYLWHNANIESTLWPHLVRPDIHWTWAWQQNLSTNNGEAWRERWQTLWIFLEIFLGARTSRKLHGKLTLWSYVGKIYRTFNFSEAMVIIDNADSVWCVDMSERVLTKHSLGSRVSFNILIIWTAIANYDDNQVFCKSTKTKSKLKVETFCQCNAILKYCPPQLETYYLELTLSWVYEIWKSCTAGMKWIWKNKLNFFKTRHQQLWLCLSKCLRLCLITSKIKRLCKIAFGQVQVC